MINISICLKSYKKIISLHFIEYFWVILILHTPSIFSATGPESHIADVSTNLELNV